MVQNSCIAISPSGQVLKLFGEIERLDTHQAEISIRRTGGLKITVTIAYLKYAIVTFLEPSI
jgi:hypothetical protein